MDVGWWLIVGALYVSSIVVCFQKGKTGFGAVGVVGLIPFLTPILGWFPVIGAVRLAKPNSGWAQRRYGPGDLAAAKARFPGVGSVPPPTPTPPHLSYSDQPSQATPSRTDPEASDHTKRSIISAFLSRAHQSGVIDTDTHARLIRSLGPDGRWAEVPTQEQVATSPSMVEPPSLTPPPAPQPKPPAPAPASSPPPQPTSAPRPVAQRPVAPVEPGLIATKATEYWKALSSDVAIHGFAYLGVLLTFVGVLGFLLFAFVDVPDAAQPLVELFIALVFFGWAWVLRRQKADRVANGMELVGGMVLPLILFAGLVDNAPFPPDFQGGALVVALTVTAVGLAVVYAWISTRNPNSTLRFLIAPLLWLGAMTLGFVFKSNEVLRSDAIIRLVSAQPAMASAGIAITLAVCHWRPDNRFAGPSVTASLFGLPLAYLLTIALSVGEGWEHLIPIVVLGVATLASAEFLAIWFGKERLIASFRPLLVAAVVAPLIPVWTLGWTGLVVTLLYVGLFEWNVRADSSNVVALTLSGIGVAAGLIMSLTEPWAALSAFAVGSVWAHGRRIGPDTPQALQQGFLAAAAVLPVGIGYELHQVTEPAMAWLIMSAILAAVTVAVRWRRNDGAFWAYWPSAAAWLVAAGAVATRIANGDEAVVAATTLGLTAGVVGLGPRWPALRLWMGAALGSVAFAFGLQALDALPARQAVIWALVGLVLVFAALLWRRRPSGHLAAIGHVLGFGALFALQSSEADVVVLAAWTMGWIASVVSAEIEGESLTALFERVTQPDIDTPNERLTTAARWVAPALMVTSLPPAILSAANLWDRFADHRSWTGMALGAIAVGYAVTARLVRDRRPLNQALALGAIVTSVIGVAVAAPDSWPTIIAAGSVIAVAAILSGDLRRPGFVWFAWIMSVLMALLLAERAGVGTDRLYLVSLVWGGVMLLGGVVFDDIRSGRRGRGQGLRLKWLRYPVLLGALVMPLSLGPAFTLGSETYGWWSLGAAGTYFAVAVLVRVGAVAAPAYVLATVGLAALSPWSLIDQPWRFIVIAVPLVIVSLIAERIQPDEISSDAWLRWDLAPLVVAQVVGVFALVIAMGNEAVLPSALAFGALSVAIGLWRRHRAWIEVGNFLILVAAFDAGTGWLALALAATAVRGVVSTFFSPEDARVSYQLIGVTSAGLSWLVLVDWQDYSPVDATNYSVMLFASLALAVAVLARLERLQRDTVLYWGGLAMAGTFITAGFAIWFGGPGIQGPWFAIGLLLVAAAFEIGAEVLGQPLRLISVLATGLSWITLTSGLKWERTDVISYSAIIYGGLGLAIALLLRIQYLKRSDALRWGALATVGVILTGLVAIDSGASQIEGPALAMGIALLGLGFELAARDIQPELRYVTVLAVGSAWGALVVGLGWDLDTVTTWSMIVFGLMLLTTVELSRLMGTADEAGPDGTVVPPMYITRAWAGLGALGVLASVVLATGMTDPAGPPYWIAGGFGMLAAGMARGAAPLRVSWLRHTSVLASLASVTSLAIALEATEFGLALAVIGVAVLGTACSLLVWKRRPDSVWMRPLIVLGVAANLEAAGIAVNTLPSTGLLVAALLSIGIQAVAVGITLDRAAVLAIGPPTIGLAFLLMVSESVSGSAQWYTIPIGLVLLSEVEILRHARQSSGKDARSSEVLLLEWAGIALLCTPALVEMFTTSIVYGLIAFGLAGLGLLWAIVTKVRRRAMAAASLAVGTTVLVLFAAAAGGAPESAFFWIVAVGVGFAVSLVAALVEAYRSKKGHIMLRVDQLMEGWS